MIIFALNILLSLLWVLLLIKFIRLTDMHEVCRAFRIMAEIESEMKNND